MYSDFGERHHHFYHHYPHVGWLHEMFPLFVLADMLVMVAVAWLLLILLAGDPSERSQHSSGLASLRASVRQRWHGAVRTHAATARQFAAYECTPAAVDQHPDLADVTCPATALFIDAFAEANGLATEHYPGAQHAARFIQAAQRAQWAWQAAVAAARHGEVSQVTPHQPVLLHQAVTSPPVQAQSPRTHRRFDAPKRHTDSTLTRPGRHRASARHRQHSLDRPPVPLKLPPPGTSSSRTRG